ncbi:Two-component sensor CbrA: intrcellular carbon:nitrogen balance, partial [hydrothermal vent metagenome]
KIIEDILLMSKPHVANQIDINLFESLTKFQAEFCQQHNIDTSRFNVDCPDKLLIIQFDAMHLSQLFWNLAKNALKHGQDNNLSVSISNQPKYIFIDFKNSGATFESIVEESLFIPFFTTHTQGTGLGLYICREMCKSNNAKLEYLYQEFQHVFRIHVKK